MIIQTASLRVALGTALLLLPLAAHAAADSDGDGVPDFADEFPCDPALAATAFAPGEGQHGMVLLEDLWPQRGDFDFNDESLAYNYVFQLDAAGKLVRMQASINVLSIGASIANSALLHLPVPASSAASITLNIGDDTPQPIAPLPGQPDLVIELVHNTRSVFKGYGPSFVNTDPSTPSAQGRPINLIVRFAQPIDLDLGVAPFDLFIARVDDPRHEIHLPGYAGTARMDASLFDTQSDGSSANRHFVTTSGIPFGLAIPYVIPWPKERAPIDVVYPDIVAFGASAGAQHADWYTTNILTEGTWTHGANNTPPPVPQLGTPGFPAPQTNCSSSCTNVVCTPLDACHLAGTCDPATGLCSNPVAPDGSACNDSDACTRTDTCQAGLCMGANPVVCAASDQCHDAGTCDSSTGTCSNPNKANGAICSDGDACTQTDTCQAGLCMGANPVTCTASDQCHVAGTCDSSTGTCSNPDKADGSICNDGNACTQTDTCQAGSCMGANPVVCTASDQCHDAGICDSSTGACSNPNKANGAICTDGNACTQTDTCQAGLCMGANPVVCTASDQCHDAGICDSSTGSCSNPNKANGATCSDGNACTQTDTCQAGVCTGANAVTCTALDQCHVAGICNPSTGTCSNPNRADGSNCTDGDACTQTDTCQAGVCTGANAVVCAALDQCHVAGACDPSTGTCSNPNRADGSSCTDGNACTQTDTCQGGVCIGANAVTCSALDQCHVAGTCNPSTGTCSNPNRADGSNCTDGNACTQLDTCQGGVCTGANAVICTAIDPCHDAGVCDPSTGSCSNPNKADGASCNDGNACTQTDTCQSGLCMGGNPVACTAADPCHLAGTCDSSSGQCSNPPAAQGTACAGGGICDGAGSCLVPSCSDGIKNGGEGDVDCGGTCSVKCFPGETCNANADCTSRNCYTGICQVGAPCTTAPADPNTGQKCPLYAPCTADSDCGVATTCQVWSCINHLCAVSAGTCGSTEGSTNCGSTMSLTHYVSPPVNKSFVTPDGANAREATTLTMSFTNASATTDLYLDTIPLTLVLGGGASQFDVASVKVYTDATQTETASGSILVCTIPNPFTASLNGQIGSCGGSAFARIPKGHGTTRFLFELTFSATSTFLHDRTYQLKLNSSSQSQIKYRSGSTSGGVGTSAGCGVPVAGFIGATLTDRDYP